MLYHKINISFLILVLSFLGCGISQEKTKTLEQVPGQKQIINCYITKPVFNDRKYEPPVHLKKVNTKVTEYLKNIAGGTHFDVDSALLYITSFEIQKEIFINYKCYKQMDKPDSIGLMDLYFNAQFSTQTMTRSIVRYIQSYDKTIFGLGNTTVFQYQFEDVSEVEPDFMYIIIKAPTEEQLRFGKDYEGFVICADGLIWRQFKQLDTPSFIQAIKGDLKFETPLLYDGQRFIPTMHFNIKPGSDMAE